MIYKHMGKDISNLVTSATWSGSRLQAGRKLELEIIQDSRDDNLPKVPINNGETVYLYDNDKLLFQGNIFSVDKTAQSSKINILAYDNLFILSKSKTTRKFTNIPAEDITVSICAEMGIKTGNIIKTGIKVSFIADNKSGYEIIMMAYTEASKTTKKKYQPLMDGDKLNVVEKGTLIEGYELDAAKNIQDVKFKETIENMVNKVMITDEQGNKTGYKSNDDWIKKYSMIQAVYKKDPNKNTDEEVTHLLKGPEKTASVEVLGDVRAVSSYSIKIRAENLTGKFWIKSDSHKFDQGTHLMTLEIEFENLMDEHKADHEKDKKGGGK